ncbi:ATP-dependent DNA helicase [Fusarium oxysporum f. sp. albedinis]|nr:ATP-dependent DNA helicase [Fusarium oxysporum f. sp. albedinis]
MPMSAIITISSISEAFTYTLHQQTRHGQHAKVSNHRHLVHPGGVHLRTTPADTPTSVIIAISSISEASTYILNTSRHAKVRNHRHLVHLGDVHLQATPADTPRSVIITISSISEASTYILNTSRHAKVSNHRHLVHLRGVHLPATPGNTPESAIIAISSISETSTYKLHQQTRQGQQSSPSRPSRRRLLTS